MTVHPDPARSIVFAGDKNGHIACWDATDAGKLRPGKEAKAIRDGDAAKGGEAEDDEDEEDERQWGKWWHWKAHADSSVSFLKFRPGDRNAVRPASSLPSSASFLLVALTPRERPPARSSTRRATTGPSARRTSSTSSPRKSSTRAAGTATRSSTRSTLTRRATSCGVRFSRAPVCALEVSLLLCARG